MLETEENFGHWVCIKVTGKRISFFDSYGGFPDRQKHFVNEDFLKSSGQEFNKLCQLLYECSFRYTVEFSQRPLQNIRNLKLATCGLWCCVFIKSGLTVDPFYEFIDSFNMKDKDALVVMLYYDLPIKNDSKKKKIMI